MREIQRQCAFFFTLKRRSGIFSTILAIIRLFSGGGEKSIFDFRNDFARPFASTRISATTFKRRVAIIGLEPRIKEIKTEGYSQKYGVA